MDTTMVVLLVIMAVLFVLYIGRRRARLKDED
jgi:hypothetical protein